MLAVVVPAVVGQVLQQQPVVVRLLVGFLLVVALFLFAAFRIDLSVVCVSVRSLQSTVHLNCSLD